MTIEWEPNDQLPTEEDVKTRAFLSLISLFLHLRAREDWHSAKVTPIWSFSSAVPGTYSRIFNEEL